MNYGQYGLWYGNCKKNLSTVTKRLVDLNTFSKVSSRQCILDKKGICGGFSVALSDLCNKVGIDSYVVSGKATQQVTEMYHAWVAVKIGKGTYYVDPTYDNGTKQIMNCGQKRKWRVVTRISPDTILWNILTINIQQYPLVDAVVQILNDIFYKT